MNSRSLASLNGMRALLRAALSALLVWTVPAWPQTAGQLKRVEAGIVSRTFFYVPVWAGIERGFFREEGLDVNLTIFGNASQVEPLISGRMHVAIGTPEAVLQNAAAGGPLRLVAGNTGKLSHSLIVNPRFSRIEDLKGATFGILNMTEGSFFQIREMMARHGLYYPADYHVKEMGGVPPRHKALLAGTIDAGLQSIPWNYVAEDAGFKSLADINTYVPDWQFVSVNVNNDWAKANRAMLVSFLRALSRATDWVYANRAEAAAIAERELPTKRAYAERAWDYYTSTNALTRDLALNRSGLEKVIQVQIQAALLPKDAPTDSGRYIEPSYLEEARATMNIQLKGR
jgi:ABC-type nitrate/sulfonate/bicarbonate transport system substrate-binding protein